MMLSALGVLLIVTCLDGYEKKYPVHPNDWGMTTIQMIENHGYPVEIHKFTTEDGYNLEYHRVPFGLKNKDKMKNRSAIILMNGLCTSSAIEFAQGPDRALGYILADAGYDVWVVNFRGNQYSLTHNTLDPIRDEKKFYDFSFHEIGYYDLPAAIDYITNVTKNNAVFFYGNSLGSTAFLVFGASRPEYLKKIKLAQLVSPTAYLKRNKPDDYLGYLLNKYLNSFVYYWQSTGPWNYDGASVRSAWKELTSPFYINLTLNGLGSTLVNDEDAESLRPYIGAYLYNMPSPTPIKAFVHYAQLIDSGKFRQFDYGKEENKKRYGTTSPPQYNISNIVCPVAIYSAKFDFITPYNQQVKVKRQLPNLVYEYVETTGRYNHISFAVAPDLRDRIWKKIVYNLEKYR